MHFSACYDDDCYIHPSAKESCSGRGWFTRKPRQYNPESVIDKTRQQMISAICLYTATSKPALNVKILGDNGKIPTKGSDVMGLPNRYYLGTLGQQYNLYLNTP